MTRRIQGIRDVAEWQMCTGCGACAYVQPDDIRMVDDATGGRRPLVEGGEADEPSTEEALSSCPGTGLAHDAYDDATIPELRAAWGPVLEVWEGYATDPEIRFRGSSGGVATALATHSLERQGYHGVLHVRARTDAPLLNETTLSRDRRALIEATGSRYSPASPCERLDLIRDAPGPCVFIGKPCDVAATAKVRCDDPLLDRNLALTIGIFCAGTPTTQGTLELVRAMGVDDPEDVRALRYRGNGWPGEAEAVVRLDTGTEVRNLSYEESWGEILQKHRQWRCYVCADHTGEFADIAVGDPWYREIEPDDAGWNLIVVRTDGGRRALAAALRSGYVSARRVDPGLLPESQPGLSRVRGAVWGRIVASRLAGIPAPRYRGLATFSSWIRSLSWRERVRSIIGVWRRIRRKGLLQRHPVIPAGSPPAEHRGRPGVEAGSEPEEARTGP